MKFTSVLTENDFIILEYIKKHPNVEDTAIIEALHDTVDGIPFRLDQLSKNDAVPRTNGKMRSIESCLDCRYYSNVAFYKITGRGETELQDYKLSKSALKRNQTIALATLALTIITAIASVISAIK